MTMDLLFLVYLIKQKPNIKQEYYKTQQSEWYYAHAEPFQQCKVYRAL